MWIGVSDAINGAALTNAGFNYAFQNYSGSDPGWYWVEVFADSDLYCYVAGYNTGYANTDSWDSGRFNMVRPGGKK